MSVLDYIMGLKAGEASGGGGGTNFDFPIFTATYDSEWVEIQSITCNKTLAECYEIYHDEHQYMALLIEKAEGDDTDYFSGLYAYSADTDGTNPTSIYYVLSPDSSADVVYTTEGIEYVEPSGYPEELTVTENGEYEANTVYKIVTVEVP